MTSELDERASDPDVVFTYVFYNMRTKVDMKFSKGSNQGIISKIVSKDNRLKRVERGKFLFSAEMTWHCWWSKLIYGEGRVLNFLD